MTFRFQDSCENSTGLKNYTLRFSAGQAIFTKPIGSMKDPLFLSYTWEHVSRANWFAPLFRNEGFVMKYTIFLHPGLRLNITFLHIYLVGSEFRLRPREWDSRDDFVRSGGAHIVVSSRNRVRTENIFFTRHYSKFTLFSDGFFIEIKNVPRSRSILISSSTYQVIDSDAVVSLKYTEPRLTVQTTSNDTRIILPRLKILLTLVHVKVPQFCRVKMTLVNTGHINHSVFDGPGILSQVLSPAFVTETQFYFLGSSFQLSVFLCLSHKSDHNTRKGQKGQNLQYKAIYPKLISHVFVNSTLSINDENKNMCWREKHCVVKLFASPGKIFNFTFHNFSLHGTREDNLCNYAGISLYKDKYRKAEALMNTLCVKQYFGSSFSYSKLCSADLKPELDHFDNFRVFEYQYPDSLDKRTVYSESSSAVLVKYFFPEYSTMSVRVTVTTSRCRVLASKGSVHVMNFVPCQVAQFEFSGHNTISYGDFYVKAIDMEPDDAVSVTATGVLRGTATWLRITETLKFNLPGARCSVQAVVVFGVHGCFGQPGWG